MSELPLIQAASIGDMELVLKLLAAGHDVDERGEPLSKEELKSLQWFLNETNINEAAGAAGRPFDYTPLMAALNEGYFEIAHVLLDAGADANATDSLKRTPLMLAVGWKESDLVERLIAAGSDVDAKNACGDPVLTQAINKLAWNIVDVLLEAGANPDPSAKTFSIPLVAATFSYDAEAKLLMKRLVELGAKPRNSIPLANAAQTGDLEFARRLVELGSPLTCDHWLYDPLSSATRHRNHQVTRYLLDQGVKVVEKSSEKGILCAVASGGEHEEEAIATAEALLAAGAQINHADSDGYTPLHQAASSGRPLFTRWLLEHDADYTRCHYGERTPLDAAEKELERAQGILNKHLDRDPEGNEWTPKFIRQIEGLKRAIAVLKEFGACRANDNLRPSIAEHPVRAVPPAERRGLCDDTFFKAHQVMIRTDIDKISNILARDKKFIHVERDVYSRRDQLEWPTGDILALVKLKGHPWVYVADFRRPRGDSPMKLWSNKLKCPVLYAGQESVSGCVFYVLYERGDCVEAFESDGVWFQGGVEIDPEVQDESERMHGTAFSSLVREVEEINWTAYESEWQFLDRYLRDQEAYLTFMWAAFSPESDRLEVSAYHDDEITEMTVERIDLAYYKPTPQQQRVVQASPQQEKDPLFEAIGAKDFERAKQAIAAGVDFNRIPLGTRHSYLVHALYNALKDRNYDIVDLLLQSGADPNYGGKGPALTELITWVGETADKMELVLKLLAAGANINACTPSQKGNPFFLGSQSALHFAARNGEIHLVKFLLRHGANATLKDDNGCISFDAARSGLKSAKQNRVSNSNRWLSELLVSGAQATVDLLRSVEKGDLDLESLPSDEELIAAERSLQEEITRVIRAKN